MDLIAVVCWWNKSNIVLQKSKGVCPLFTGGWSLPGFSAGNRKQINSGLFLSGVAGEVADDSTGAPACKKGVKMDANYKYDRKYDDRGLLVARHSTKTMNPSESSTSYNFYNCK